MTVAHNKVRQQRTSGRNDEKMVARHKQKQLGLHVPAAVQHCRTAHPLGKWVSPLGANRKYT